MKVSFFLCLCALIMCKGYMRKCHCSIIAVANFDCQAHDFLFSLQTVFLASTLNYLDLKKLFISSHASISDVSLHLLRYLDLCDLLMFLST